MLADKQVPVLNPVLLPKQTYKQHFSPFICVRMAKKNPKKTKTQSDYLSDSDSSEDEVSQHLHTSPEERLYSQRFGASDTSSTGSYNHTV